MSIAGMHDKTADEDEDFDSIDPDRGADDGTLREGDSVPGNVENRKEQRWETIRSLRKSSINVKKNWLKSARL